MSNFLKLVFINIRSTFSTNKISISKNRITKTLSYLVLVIFPLAYLGYVGYILGEQLALANMQKVLIVLAIVGSVSLVLINSIVTSFELLFKSKDYDFINSLPISKFKIILAKIVSIIMINYLYSSLLFLPFSVCYYIFAGVTFSSIMSCILTFAFLPLLPITIGIVIGLLINLIFSKLRLKKLFVFISMLLLLFGSMYISMDLNSTVNYFIVQGEQLSTTISNIYYPVFLSIDGIVNSNLLSILWFILINSIPLILLVFICSKFYVKLNSYFMKSHYKYDKTIKKVKNLSVSKALIVKEIKRLFASPMYFMNSCIGPIFLLIMIIASKFFSSEAILGFDISSDIFYLAFFFFMFNSIMSPMSCTISLEGDTFWLLKSFPIKVRKILNSKLAVQYIVFLPLNLIAIVFLLIFNANFVLPSLVLLLTSITSITLSGIVGLIINLKKNNLHYTNELMIIKQSSPVLYSMLIGVGSALLMNLLYSFVFSTILSSLLFVTIFCVFSLIACAIIYRFIYNFKYNEFIQID